MGSELDSYNLPWKPKIIIRKTHLNPDFRQVDLHGQFFAAVHVRIMRLLERPLQLVKLIGGERGAVPAVLFLVGRRHSAGRGRWRRARPATGQLFVVRFAVTAVAAPTAAHVVHVGGPTLLRWSSSSTAISSTTASSTASTATNDASAAAASHDVVLVGRHKLMTVLLGVTRIAAVFSWKKVRFYYSVITSLCLYEHYIPQVNTYYSTF